MHNATSEDVANIHSLIASEMQAMKLLYGKGLVNQIQLHGVYADIQEAEFCAFSQFGDDGIIQYLVEQTKPQNHMFVEFGVENYREANTRFLLMNDNWKGLVMDGSAENIDLIKHDPIHWRYDLTAVHVFIDRDNINAILRENGFSGEIGLLSVDIDGNDYWVWKAIDVVNPILVVVEYNSVFGAEHAITIPYDPTFYRAETHFSNLYWGASLKALCLLAEEKGYAFVGCNSAGNNAHFVRKDRVGRIPAKTTVEGYVESRFRESRDKDGNLTFLGGTQRLEAIKDMQVFDIENGKLVFIRDLFNLKQV
jgi:hypothetical protein